MLIEANGEDITLSENASDKSQFLIIPELKCSKK
jgi:hypothetical protein